MIIKNSIEILQLPATKIKTDKITPPSQLAVKTDAPKQAKLPLTLYFKNKRVSKLKKP
jgi:hypothetical protein